MTRLLLLFTVCLTLSLVPTSVASSEEIKLPDFSCLSRSDQEVIVTDHEQKLKCQELLNDVLLADPSNEWLYYSGSFLLGLVGGFILRAQVHK